MKSFLYQVASLYYDKYRDNIRKYTFVFPNKRAGYFFQKHLSELIDQVFFSPDVVAINDLFYSLSDLKLTDRTKEIFRLYDIYKGLHGGTESFDDFVFWGDVLLSDFDDIDKYRLDAKQIFTNIRDLNEIKDVFDYLTDEQRKAIMQFWSHFLPETDKETKKNFVEIWRILFQLYENHRSQLRAEGLATEGMVLREVVDRLESSTKNNLFEDKNFVFIGFNALNPCEKALFVELKKREKADFYWDYYADELIDIENNASLFHKDNLRDFPSKFELEISNLNSSFKDKSIELLAIPSAVGQVKMVHNILDDIYQNDNPHSSWIDTAVVIPDEKLLEPMLYSLPQHIDSVNITMGYPLSTTPVVSLVEAVFELYRRRNSKGDFYHKAVKSILNHQMIYPLCKLAVDEILDKMISGNFIYVNENLFEDNILLQTIFKRDLENEQFLEYLLAILLKLLELNEDADDLSVDFLYQYFITVNRLNDVIRESDNLDMSLETLHRFLRQLVSGVTIPFEGEPLNGLQIMGTLETRGLDFENLIICSFNEGVFPKGQSSVSFVPYNLRRAFNLPTEEYHDAIASYNFYRLIQRSQNIYFLYDSRTDGMQTGEVSRYFYQLQYHYGVKINEHNIAYKVNLPDEKLIEVQKTDEIMKKLEVFLHNDSSARSLSPSSLNTYIDCPLKFYLAYVEGLREIDEVEEAVEAAMFGTLLHFVLEHIYKRFEGEMVHKSHLQPILDNDILIDKLIRKAFLVEFYNQKDKNEETEIVIEGEKILAAKVIKKQIKEIIKLDIERTPFLYIQSEKNIKIKLPIFDGKLEVNLMGKIDRVDQKDEIIRVLDYKTGRDKLEFKNLEQVFEKDGKDRPKVVLQTLLYSLLYQIETGTARISPEVLSVREVFKGDISTQLRQKDYSSKINQVLVDFNDYKDEFMEKLINVLEEIFDPEIAFSQCKNTDLCKYCPFINICNRQVGE